MAIIYKTFRAARTVFCATFVCFFVALALMSSPAMAQEDLYKVEGVVVDVTADSALAARDQAFDKAQIDAFTILAGRMLSESEVENFKAPDIATVSTLVQDYEVTAEKLSSVRYIGTYTITFRGSAVERFFNVQGKTYTNVVSAPLVILPFYQVAGKNYLWSPYNVWMRAWNRGGSGSALVPVILPIGDLEDVSDIGDDDVFGYNPNKLAALLKRYDAGDAVIAVATADGRVAKLTENDNAAGGAVTVSLYRTDRGSPEHVGEMVVDAQGSDTLAQLLDRAVVQTQTALKQNWKDKTAVAPTAASTMPAMPTGNSIIARVKIASLEEWAGAQKSLGRVGAVTGTQLKSLSPKEALIELSFRGDENMLRAALAQSGMSLGFPQYAGPNSTEDNRLIYDLALSGRPVIQQQPQPQHQQFQPSGYHAPQNVQPQGGSYQGGTYQGGYQQQKISPNTNVVSTPIPVPAQPDPATQLNNARPSAPFGGYAVPQREKPSSYAPQGYTGRF